MTISMSNVLMSCQKGVSASRDISASVKNEKMEVWPVARFATSLVVSHSFGVFCLSS